MGVLLRPMATLPDTSRQLRTYLNQAKIHKRVASCVIRLCLVK
jgi:hypothetical protein